MNREQTEDLKAFENRLTECVNHIRVKTNKWRVLLVLVCIWTFVSLWLWWIDNTEHDSYWEMFTDHKSLSLSIIALFCLYLFGFIERNNATPIVMSRCRSVLQEYNMSCDEHGKLILKRKPTPKYTYDLWKTG